MITLQLTDKEAALIAMIRRQKFGTIEKLSFRDGEPEVAVLVHQRFDFDKDGELRVDLLSDLAPKA